MRGEGERRVLSPWLKAGRKVFLGMERRMTEAFEPCSVEGGGLAPIRAGRRALLLFMLGHLRLSY